MRNTLSLLLAGALLTVPFSALAGRGSDAVVGSIIGGTAGAIIGNGFGGRDGAIVGSAIGAAAGVAIATDGNGQRYPDHRGYDHRYRDYGRDRYSHRTREVVVLESPRYYYEGTQFVYGVPARPPVRGHQQRWDRHDRHHNHDRYCRHEVIVVQPERYHDHGHRRW